MVNTTFRGCFYLNHAFLRSVPGLQYDNIVHVYTAGHTNVNHDSLVNTITDSVMHQSIPAVPIPPPRAIVGHFPALSIPGVGALAFHPITPGHLTISLLSPHNIIVFFFNDHFIGKYGKFLLEYV